MNASQRAGQSAPLGATLFPDGVNFSVFSRNASAVELLLFDRDDAPLARVIPIDAASRTNPYWHVFVPGVRPGQLYGYRVSGPSDAANGMRFDSSKILLDPYGRAVAVPKSYSRTAASQPGDNAATAMKSVVADLHAYDWEGDEPLHSPVSRCIIYEMHVRGFTRDPSSGVAEQKRGTYAGLIDKIPYLQHLGITAVEFMPVFQFDIQDAPSGQINYWGYAPVSFFAPHHGYCSQPDPLAPINEFRDMVKALHRAGIEVILDVVFNHTAEGTEQGPTVSFRGLDNTIYYILQPDHSGYANYSGTGNTLNGNHPIVRRMIVDSLRYWVEEMHVDGFRFDLASILDRDESGNLMPAPPVLWDIDSDPVLAGTKLIAEAWDAAGLYQVGNFVGNSFREWNGRFRDDVRSFWRGDTDTVPAFADRLIGSPGIYEHKQREPEQSVNFVTCHDGFTLNDLVSYNQKHNEANGEQNRDGGNDNRSCNWGVEGLSTDPSVERLRNRMVKNFLTVTMLSLGLPMISMGDEVRRTQQGNNNPYSQDNPVSWFDWSLVEKRAGLLRFVTMLLFQRHLKHLSPEQQRLSLSMLLRQGNRSWHGVKLGQPDWGANSHSLALSVTNENDNHLIHLMMNAYWKPLDFELPSNHDVAPWRRWIDTNLESPDDIMDWRMAPPVTTASYRVEAHSLAVLFVCEEGFAG